MRYGLLLIAIALVGCANDASINTQVPLEGKWVDVNTKTDTLTFGAFGDQGVVTLSRGKEIRDGFLLPKYGSGPYNYSLSANNKISLRWFLSSNASFNDYYLKQSGDKLIIEKFFDPAKSGTLLTFKKID